MAILLIVRESETFYLKSTTTNLWESNGLHTQRNALLTLISNINNQFYYIGEENDKVAPIDVKKFTGEEVEYCVAFIDSLEIEKNQQW